MVDTITLLGIVLTAMPVGDYDKRLVILTKERGKITVFARGARKQNSALLACSQPFSFGQFTVYEGRNAYTLTTVQISNYFVPLRENLEMVSYGMYFCELAEYFSRENISGTNVLKLLYQSLKALYATHISNELIRYIYELRIIALEGQAPQVFECVKCKKEEDIVYFSSLEGGLLCKSCKSGKKYSFLCTSSVYTMQYILTSKIEALYTFTVTDQVLSEVGFCMKEYFRFYLDKEFKSLEMLQLI